MNNEVQTTSSSDTPGPAFDLEGRALAPGAGLEWYTQAWPLFMRQPGVWIGVFVAMVVVFLVASLIPVIGQIAAFLLWPVIAGGLMLGAREVDRGGSLTFGHLTAGFSTQVGQLILVGVIYLVGMVVALFIATLFAGVGIGAILGASGDGAGPEGVGATALMLTGLVALGLMLPIYMATWFAPALIVCHEIGATLAMKASFFGCLKNIVPFIVYGIIGMLLSFVAAIPAGLGWLVLGPVFVASVYVGYREIYLGG